MNRTKSTYAKFENYLNELYSDIYSASQAVDNFCYLNNGKIKENTIINAHTNHMLGTLLRKYDPIGFHVAFNERHYK